MPAAVAVLHKAGEDVPMPQKAHGSFHLTRFQKRSQMRRADGDAVQLHFSNDIAAEPERAAFFRQLLCVSDAARTEAVVVPADQMAGVKLFYQIVLDKRLPGHVHHVPVKVAEDHVLDAVERLHQLLSLVHRVQKLCRCSEHQRVRMRIEAHCRRHRVQLARAFVCFFQKRAVPDVNAIEKAQRNDTSFVQVLFPQTSKKLLIVVRMVFSTLPRSRNSPVML